MSMQFDDFSEFLSEFLDESDGYLTQLSDNLVDLDHWVKAVDDPSARIDSEMMNEMFRAAHSLKGLSGMFGVTNVNRLTHKMENVFDAARNDELTFNAAVVDVVFQSVDRLQGMIDQMRDPTGEEIEYESVVVQIEQALAGEIGPPAASPEDTTADDDSASSLAHIVPSADVPPADVPPGDIPPGDIPSGDDSPAADVAAEREPVDHFAGILDETEMNQKYMSIFIDESEMSLDNVWEILSDEREKTRGDIEELLITCHKIKGSSASLGLNRPARLAHLMEDLLQELWNTNGALSEPVGDAMLTCADALRTYVEAVKAKGEGDSSQFNQAYAELLASSQPGAVAVESVSSGAVSSGAVSVSPTASVQAANNEPDPKADDRLAQVESLLPMGECGFAGTVEFEPGFPLVGLKAQLVHEKLRRAGQIFFCDPPANELESAADLTMITFGVVTERPADWLHREIDLEGVARVRLQPLAQEASEPVAASADVAQPAAISAGSANDPAAQPSGSQPSASQPSPAAADARSDESAAGCPTAPTQTRTKPNETLRVDIERLDQLMNLAGQLVINKSRFGQIGDGLKSLVAPKTIASLVKRVATGVDRIASETEDGADAVRLAMDLRTHVRQIRSDLEAIDREMKKLEQSRHLVTDLSDAVHQLDRVTDGIQRTVMDTRMVPIGPLFSRFKRVVRDITRGNGREVRLDIHGENTELDKRMIDELSDPLIHMVRNAVDHGIESPDDRLKNGKPRQGTLTLDACHRGNRIIISVKDDGRGIYPDQIRNKAIAKGIISQSEADNLAPHQIYQLIWEPGFSTAEKITDISGRGMGMDIVRSKIEEINGTVELDSEPGKGTQFTIRLPLTIAILPSLLTEIAGDVFAIPVESVSEIVEVKASDLSTVHGLRMATVRGRVISVIDLSRVFRWNRPGKAEVDNERDLTMVVVGGDGRELGLIVHGLLGEEDIVIKSMAENYRHVDGVAGASILGDGRVSLILDIAALMEMSCEAARDNHVA